jgi:hypothetical protein
MAEIETESYKSKETKKIPLFSWSKFFFLIAIVYIVWVIVVIGGVYYLNLGYRWAVLPMDQWMIGGIILFALLILIEFFFFIKLRRTKSIQQGSQFGQFKGKTVHIFTSPSSAKGGIFSRTYIPIDKDTFLQMRTQMIPPEELWRKK